MNSIEKGINKIIINSDIETKDKLPNDNTQKNDSNPIQLSLNLRSYFNLKTITL
jgi:hypothetical protein